MLSLKFGNYREVTLTRNLWLPSQALSPALFASKINGKMPNFRAIPKWI